MFNKLIPLFVVVVVYSFLPPVHADAEKTPAEHRVTNIYKLIHESSAAKQIINSANIEANTKRQEALDLFQVAQDKLTLGLDEESSILLKQTANLMFEALKLSTPASMTDDKVIIDYGKRRESVIALKEAFIRISVENKERESKQKVSSQLEKLVSQADSLLKNGKSLQARAEIDKAYHLLKVSIDLIRSGQTLIRSLNFANKEEEYHYEVDRNDTHSMLVNLLVEEKKQSAYMQKNIQKFVDQAKNMRQQAELHAKYEAYEKAIDLLEQSTKQLVRAIRSAGIYIPG